MTKNEVSLTGGEITAGGEIGMRGSMARHNRAEMGSMESKGEKNHAQKSVLRLPSSSDADGGTGWKSALGEVPRGGKARRRSVLLSC